MKKLQKKVLLFAVLISCLFAVPAHGQMQSINAFGYSYQGLEARQIFNLPNRCDTNFTAPYRAALKPGSMFWNPCTNKRWVFYNDHWQIDSTAASGGGGSGTDTNALHKSQNLGDIPNVITAQNNLGISQVGRDNKFTSLSNLPNTVAGYGITDAVPTSRTITINGVAHDLSANQSYTVTATPLDTTSLSARINLKKDNTDSVNRTTGYTSQGRLNQKTDSLGAAMDLKKVTNAGGAIILGRGTFAGKPSPSAGSGFWYCSDSAFFVYSDLSTWTKITDRANQVFNALVRRDGARGILIGRGHDSSIILKGLVDSTCIHLLLNADSTITVYSTCTVGGSTDTTTITHRIDSVSTHLSDTVSASANGRATIDDFTRLHTAALFLNDTTTNADSTTYAIGNTHYDKRLRVYSSDGSVGVTNEGTLHSNIYNLKAFYKTLQLNTSDQIQRQKLNLSSEFANSDNSGNNSSDISINTIAEAKITGLSTDLSSKAAINSQAFTGTPSLPTGTTAITQTAGNNSTKIATTAYADAIATLKANIASPTFTGTPAAPTASPGTNTTQLATTAFVTAAVAAAGGTSFYQHVQSAGSAQTQQTNLNFLSEFTAANNGGNSSTDISINAIAESKVTSLTTDLGLKAPLVSPTFTGTPVAPTASANNNSTQVATTAYADAIATLKANIASPTFTGTPTMPTGTIGVTQTPGNNSTALATTAYADAIGALKANINSQAFTGTPSLPTGTTGVTQSAGDNSTKLATTAYADASAAIGAAASSKVIFSATAAGSAVTNTTSLLSITGTGIGSKTILANTLTAGKTIIMHGWFEYSTGATNTNLGIWFLDSDGGSSSPFNFPASQINTLVEFTITGTIVSTGSSGVIAYAGNAAINGTVFLICNGMGVSFNSTINQTFDVGAKWTTASTSNSINMMQQFTIKVE